MKKFLRIWSSLYTIRRGLNILLAFFVLKRPETECSTGCVLVKISDGGTEPTVLNHGGGAVIEFVSKRRAAV